MTLQSFKTKILGLKLKTKLIFSFMATIILICLFLAQAFYSRCSRMLLEQSEQSTLRFLAQMEYNINLLLDNTNNISRQIMVSAYFNQEMDIDSLNTPNQIHAVNDIYNYFTTYRGNNSFIDSIFYYGADGIIIGNSDRSNVFSVDTGKENFFYSSELLRDTDDISTARISGLYSSADFFPDASLSQRSEIPYISLVRKIHTMGQTTGYIVVNIKESHLRSVYQDDTMNLSSESFLLDDHSRIISAGSKDDIGKQVDTTAVSSYMVHLHADDWENDELNQNNQIISLPYANYGLTIIHQIPYRILFSDIVILKNLIILLVAASLMLALIISLFWIYQITKPLGILVGAMDQIGRGNLGLEIPAQDSSDLGLLSKKFNEMSHNIEELMTENQKIHEQRTSLALRNMQSQINPHFLYNTLNTIKWMAMVSKAKNVADSITSLGNMLKPIFQNTDIVWSLQEELSYLKDYIRIMNYRTGGSSSLQRDLAEPLELIRIPKFILQPLIENSLLHGDPGSQNAAAITISAEPSADDSSLILLRVSDCGTGIPADRLQQIRRLMLKDDQTPYDPIDKTAGKNEIGIALRNINKRLKLQYDSHCGLDVFSEPGHGCCITLRLRQTP